MDGSGRDVDSNNDDRQFVGSTHVLESAATSSTKHLARSHGIDSLAIRSAQPQGSRPSVNDELDNPSRFSVDIENKSNNRLLGSPALRPDHSFAFQPASPRPPDVEMTTIQSTQRGRRAAYNLSRSCLLRPDSIPDLFPNLTDPEFANCQQETGLWSLKRLSKRRFNHVKLVWVYSFFLTAFICIAGVYSLVRILFLEQSSLAAIALDTPLRCDIGMLTRPNDSANAGANSVSGIVDAGASTGASLSNDIWGWKRHKGIVYANSHNDEMQGDRAFTYALSLGLAAIEADVWFVSASSLSGPENSSESMLLVGHDDKDLRNARTLKKLYLDPIWEILEKENTDNDGSLGWNGVFTDKGVPDQTLLLMIDTKNEVDATYAELQRLLIPFREKGYLSHFDRTSPNGSITDGKLTIGPLTVIGTGDTPINLILSENPRYIFKDAPLTKLNEPIIYPDPATGNLTRVEWHPSFAPMASAKLSIASHVSYITSSTIFLPIRQAFRLALSNPTLLEDADPPRFVREAHARGIEARWWGVARHPKLLRWALWGYVKDIGTDWLNADDLAEVADFSRKRSENDRLCI